MPIAPESKLSSTRGYLIRALHEWCTDNGLTPYLSVLVDAHVHVPREYVKNHEIVLNVAYEATTSMTLGNDLIEFKARFGGQSRDVLIPVSRVLAIYASENGQGMAFPAPTDLDDPHEATPADKKNTSELRLAATMVEEDVPADAPVVPSSEHKADWQPAPPDTLPPGGRRASLKRIK